MSDAEAGTQAATPVRAAPPKTAAATAPTLSSTSKLTRRTIAAAGEDRFRMIAEAAYFRAEQRGFRLGDELADWLAAEVEIDALLEADDRGRAG